MIKPSDLNLHDRGYRRATDIIDNALMDSASENRWPCYVSVRYLRDQGASDMDTIMDELKDAGWQVEMVYDGGDEDCLEIERPL